LDLNYLFHRQQVERSRAEVADSEAARAAHEGLARQYEDRIEELTADGFRFPEPGATEATDALQIRAEADGTAPA
jgi:hypothetical protein